MRRLAPLLLLSLISACSTGAGSENPPPLRDATLAVVAPLVAPAAKDQVAATPMTLAPAPIDPSRASRVGPQRAIAIRLLDALDPARIELPVPPVSVAGASPSVAPEPTSRSYENPWRAGALRGVDRRLNWQTGGKNEWRLEQAVVLPTGGAASWDLVIPAGARLELRFSAVARPEAMTGVALPAAPTQVRVTTTPQEKAAGLDETVKLLPTEFDRPLLEHPFRAELSPGPTRLRIEVTGPPGVVVSAAEPFVTTADPAALTAATGLAAADNVILIIVDAQRTDTVGPMARARKRLPLFPAMEGLYDQGTGFKHAFSVGNQTRISTYAMLSSQWPRFGRWHAIEWTLTPEDKARFYAANPPLIARLMGSAGYRTGAIGNDVFLFGHIDVGLDAGFDRVVDHRNSVKDTPWMTDSAIEWLEAHRDERFFLVLNYNAPHRPYEPPDEAKARIAPTLDGSPRSFDPLDHDYLGEIAWTDMHLQRFLDAVDALGLAGKTVVAMTADHGELFDRRHKCDNKKCKFCHKAHGVTLFDEEIHVPLVVRERGRIPAGRVLEVPISHVDLGPTFLGLGGFQPHPNQLGRDWSSTLVGGPEPLEIPIRAEARRSVAIRYQNHKYVWNDPGYRPNFILETLWNPKLGNEELYDLAADPFETRTLAPSAPPMLAQLRKIMFDQDDALSLKRPDGHSTWRLRNRAEGKLTGRITTIGRFVEATIGDRALETGGAKIRLTLNGPGVLSFRTVPDDAFISFYLELDGVKVEQKDVGTGPYGLLLLNNDDSIETGAFRAMASASAEGPSIPEGTGPAVVLWRDDPTALRPVANREGQAADAEVKSLMKTWGYQ